MKRNRWWVWMLLGFSASSADAAEWSRSEIRAVGKNLVSMAGFYMECGKRNIVEQNSYAIRSALFMGTKYLIVAGIEKEHSTWIKNGANGVLIADPSKSEKTLQTEISRDTCAAVKAYVDGQYQVADNYIAGRTR